MKTVSVILSHAQIVNILEHYAKDPVTPETTELVLLLSAAAWQTLDGPATEPGKAQPEAGNAATMAEAITTIRAYLRKEAWSQTYAHGGKKAGATKKEIVAATGLPADQVSNALTALSETLKSGGEKAGTWYRLK